MGQGGLSLLAPRDRVSQKGGPGWEGGCQRRPLSSPLGCPEMQVLREGNGISPRPSRGGRGNEAPTPRPKECAGAGASGGGKEHREGETVWKFVSPSCRAHFLFSWRSISYTIESPAGQAFISLSVTTLENASSDKLLRFVFL